MSYGSVSLHRRRRRVVPVVVVVALALGASAVVAVHRYLTDDSRRHYVATSGWPTDGQAAYAIGDDVHLGPHQRRAPIASVAKVMTAYLVLRARPRGPLVVTSGDVADTAHRRARDESVVAVRAGERLTVRQALLALLLPSANNVAVMLARFVSGSVPAFVRLMNDTAGTLGMRDTVYTDPSGFDEGTVSTAGDQLRLARHVADDPALSGLVAIRSARLPVAGLVRNTDHLLGTAGFVGTKTGSDDAAGGCFMFRARRVVDGRPVDLIGVVLGQPGHNLVDAGLYAARQLAERIAPATRP